MGGAIYYAVAYVKGVGKRRLYMGHNGKPTLRKKRAARGYFEPDELAAVRAWAKRWKTTTQVFRVSLYPWLTLDTDTGWPAPSLCSKLNTLGKRLTRRLFIREGTRSHARQWELWNYAQANGGRPPTAYPGTSNHEDRDGDGYGEAADVGCLRTGANVGDIPGARDAMRALGLCLPVGGEAWHVEEGTTWRG